MRAPLLAATLVLAAPLTSCHDSPLATRSMANEPKPRDQAAARSAEAKDAVANEAEVQQSASVPRSGATRRPTPRAGSSSGPDRPASRWTRWSRRSICSA